MAKGKYEEWLQPEKLLLIEGWARDGLTDEQIAFNMDIGTTTLYRWKNDYREIRESLKRGKDVVDRLVENALLKRALGYKYDEVTYEQVSCKPYEDEHGNIREHVLEVTKKVIKEVHPDTTAQIFWLKNRKPEEWRDKQNIEHSGETGVKIINDIPRNRS
jgi:hypothetical protein